MSLSFMQLYTFAVIIAAICFLAGFIIARTHYRDKFHNDFIALKRTLDIEHEEKEKIIADHKREIAHAVTNEWNRGYDAAWLQLKNEFKYIYQWEEEHNFMHGELETVTKEEEKNL